MTEQTAPDKAGRREFLKYGAGAIIGAAVGAGAVYAGISGQTAVTPATKLLTDTDTFIVGLNTSDATSVDPAKTFEFTTNTIVTQCYNRLVRPDYPKMKSFPTDTADTLSKGGDGKTWTATVRDGVKFHTGDVVTARDVEYSWKRAMNLKGPAYHWFEVIHLTNTDNVKAIDDKTFQFVLNDPIQSNLILNVLNTLPFSIVNQKLTEANAKSGDQGSAWLESNSAGTGPYILKSWEKENQFVLEANPNFWREPRPLIKKLIFKHMAEPTAQLTALQNGEIDVMWDPTPDMVAKHRFTPGLRVETSFNYAIRYVWPNVTIKPLDNPKVWEAMKWALDYDGIVNQLMQGEAQLLQGLIPPGLLGYDPATPFRKDVGKAKQILADAGLPSGFEMDMVTFGGVEPDATVAPKVQADFGEVGIKVNLQTLPGSEFFDKAAKQQAPTLLDGWGGGLMHPENYVPAWLIYDNKLIAYWFGWNDPKAVGLASKTAVAQSDQEAISLYQDVVEYCLQNAPFVIFMLANRNVMHRTWVGGIDQPLSWLFYEFNRFYKEKVVA